MAWDNIEGKWKELSGRVNDFERHAAAMGHSS